MSKMHIQNKKNEKVNLSQVGHVIAFYTRALDRSEIDFLTSLRQKKKEAKKRWKTFKKAMVEAEKKGKKKRIEKSRVATLAAKKSYQVLNSQYQVAKVLHPH